MNSALLLARTSIATHGKSFALASKLLPWSARDSARVVYAWCRRVDDAIDDCPPGEQALALGRLTLELDDIYSDRLPTDPLAAALQRVVRQTNIPRDYPAELLRGMRMDVERHLYASWDDLLLYCHRVAGVVGLMMCHVLGVEKHSALRHAAHLGIAMQLTNIARDVVEDWNRSRLYLPDALLKTVACGGLTQRLGEPFPQQYAGPVGEAVRHLLHVADDYYRSGDRGMSSLRPRAALSVRTARLVYSDIGRQIARADYDVLRGRAYVGRARKLLLAARAAARTLVELPSELGRSSVPAVLTTPLSFPRDILPV